jgi:hypothetical protein
MINFVLKKFVKKLNNLSLSANERAAMRGDFLTRTGLCAYAQEPSLKCTFVITPSKKGVKNGSNKVDFDLQLVEDCLNTSNSNSKVTQKLNLDNETMIEPIDRDVMLKVSLNVLDGPKTFVLMKVSPSKEAL